MSTSSEKAYETIRAGILAGDFTSGKLVPEDELAQYCGVSRTPVREAIARLVSEMLLQRNGTNRVFVPNWSESDVEEIFDLRTMLERHCAQRAAQFITAEQLSELKQHCAFIEEKIESPTGVDVPGFVEGNRRFHAVMTEAAQSEPLKQMLNLVVSQVIVHQTAEHYVLNDVRQSQRDHNDFVAAFEARDADWAGAIASAHIRRAANSYRRSLNKPETQSGGNMLSTVRR